MNEPLRAPVSDDLSDGVQVAADRHRLVCINCGGVLRNQKCKLICSNSCGYFESCSDPEPAVQNS